MVRILFLGAPDAQQSAQDGGQDVGVVFLALDLVVQVGLGCPVFLQVGRAVGEHAGLLEDGRPGADAGLREAGQAVVVGVREEGSGLLLRVHCFILFLLLLYGTTAINLLYSCIHRNFIFL